MWYMNAENDMTWDYEIEDAYKNLSLVMSPYTKGMNAEAHAAPLRGRQWLVPRRRAQCHVFSRTGASWLPLWHPLSSIQL